MKEILWCVQSVTGLIPEGVGQFRIHLPMKMEQTQFSETSAIKHHTPENNPKGYTRHTENGESLKSRISVWVFENMFRS
jgi:hypothetical protein